MKLVSRTALAVMLAFSAASMAAAPAAARDDQEQAEAPKLDLSRKAAKLLGEVQEAQQAGDNATALAKLKEAEAVLKTPDDRYMANAMKLNVAIATKDDALLEEALKGALASGSAQITPEKKTNFRQNLARLALDRKDTATAISIYEQMSAEDPTNGEVLVNLGEMYNTAGDTAKAVATIRKAIAAQQAKGIAVPENWYKRNLALAYDANLKAELTPASLNLVRAYPTPTNWRDVLIIYRDGANLDDQALLDLMRLMHQTNAMNGESDYAEYAETANRRGLPGEAKAILDEGKAKNFLSDSKAYVKELSNLVAGKVKGDKASLAGLDKEARTGSNGKLAKATADGFLGYGENAKAADLYKVALQKGGVDAAEVNTRLGIALTRAGDRAGAEAAFKAVQGEPRQTLAQFWLAYLNAGTKAAATAPAPAQPAQPAATTETPTQG